MSTNIKDAKSASSIPPMEAGTYPAVCCGVIDLGLQKTAFDGREKEINQILIIWEFPTETIEVNGEQKPRWMSRIYTFSVSERASLRIDLKSWRGRDFTQQELSDFDIVNVIGAPCTITVTQTIKGGIPYSNVSGIGKIMKGLNVAPPVKKYYFNIDNQETWDIFPELPEWIQRKINDSLTLKNQGIQIDRTTGMVVNIGKPVEATACSEISDAVDDTDDLPF